jgi:hypothetical protein
MRYGEYKQHINENVYQNASTGYVLTPSELAYEMVSTLPDSVFESDSTTFLDPICKSGTFLFEVIERLYDKGHSVSNIQSRIFTIDSNSHSLNIAKSVIRRILNKESGSFAFNTKIDFIEKYFNRLTTLVTKGKFKTISEFLNIIVLDKNDKNLMVIMKKNISDFISQYEKISKLESKLFGEVFTPRQLIEEMLDTLPEDVWKNKDLKWLDPAVGIGNFSAAILDRLMIGLKDVIGDEDDRKKHILEEMLYFCEISTKNLFLLYMLFDKNNEYNLNVYRGSFLTTSFDKHFKEVWGLNGFDVIIGNPPYQSGDRKSKGTGNTLWDSFTNKSIDILNKSGHLCFVHPSGWRNPYGTFSKLWKKMSSKYIKYLSINDINEGLRVFGAATRFDFYCLCNEDPLNRKSTIKFQDGNVVDLLIKDEPFIPNADYEFFKKLLADKSEDRIDVVYDSSIYEIRKPYVQKNKDQNHIYPIIKYISKTTGVPDIWYSSKNLGHIGIPKVVFGVGSQVGKIMVDTDGEYGLYCFSMGVTNGKIEELDKIREAMDSDKFRNIMKSCQFNTEMYNRKVIALFKKDFWKEFIG